MSNAGGHVIIGATSEIGRAVALRLAQKYSGNIIVAGRDMKELHAIARDISIRTSTSITPIQWDGTAFDGHAGFLMQCVDTLGSIEGVVFCQGMLASQSDAPPSGKVTREMIDVNYTSMVSALDLFADCLERQSRGYICGVSSVAGDRGRASNYHYGATKAAVSAYLSGLRARLFSHGVSVITIKPGFVDTSMTWSLINPRSLLMASPAAVADDIVRAIDRRRSVVYTPWFWRPIMFIIRVIPEWLFKRLSI